MWLKIKAFLGKRLIFYSIATCAIIGIAAWRIDIMNSVAEVQLVLLLQTVILEIGIAADLKRRVKQKLRLIMIPVSVDFRYGSARNIHSTRHCYSENLSRRNVPLHKLLLWVLPALYLLNIVCSIMN